MADKIIYKNHCTPQETTIHGGTINKWYQDSDCGRKLTGTGESKSTSIGTPVTGTFSSTINLTSVKFIHVKNTDTSGSNYLLLNIGSMGAVIKLGPGESFSSDVGESSLDSTTVTITASGTPNYEYIKGA